jgi:hypothetical protein
MYTLLISVAEPLGSINPRCAYFTAASLVKPSRVLGLLMVRQEIHDIITIRTRELEAEVQILVI